MEPVRSMDTSLKVSDSRIRHIIEGVREELGGLRTNRPTPQLVEEILVDYAGSRMKVKQLGSISVAPPREIQITAWDKNAAPLIAKAIESSPLGLAGAVQGNVVRVNLPPLNEERRAELMKIAKGIAEKFRIRLRSLRDEENKKIEGAFKEKTIGEDQKFKLKKQVQEAVDTANGEIEEAVGKKVGEIGE